MKKIIIIFGMLLLANNINGYEFLGTITGETAGDQFGSAFCTLDFNNDGFDDLVISAPASDENGVSSGKVYIYYGGASADLIPDLTITGTASSFFGKALALAGDINVDGSEDLLVGAPFYDTPYSNAGAVFQFYGGSFPDTYVDNIITGEAENDYFGISVSGVGDFNNDGYSDFAIGAYRADWGSFEDAGKVYLYYGGNPPDFVADLTLTGEANGERFGFAIAGNDFNANGIEDIAVGAYSYDDLLINQGRIYLFYGGGTPDIDWDLTIEGSSAGEKYGWALTSGLINNDSYYDLVMGTDGFSVGANSAGKIFVYYGGSGIDAIDDDSYALDRAEDDYLGFCVASGIDINGDNNHEIVAGMPGNDDKYTDAGGGMIFNGGNAISVDTSVYGGTASEEMGNSAVIWQNYGNLSSYVIAVGASDYDNFRGKVYFYKTFVSDEYICGDVNDDNDINILDIVYIVNYKYKSGPSPIPLASADVNGDGEINILDIVYLINYKYKDGPDLACG